MLLTFAIPIALITLFAFAFGGAGSDDTETKISMQVSDLDNTQASQDALLLLDSLKNVRIIPSPLTQAQEKIKKGEEACVLVIHKGFADSLAMGKELPLELQYDAARSIEVGLLQQSLIPTVATMPFNLGDPRMMMGNRFDRMVGNADTAVKSDIHRKSDNLFNALSIGISKNTNKSSNVASDFFGGEIKMSSIVADKKDNNLGLIQAVAGTAVMMLLFSVVGIGMGILDEKQEGTLKRLLYAPLNPIQILLGKMLSANIISIFQLIIMFLFASLVFGLDIFSHLSGLIITIIATAFACSAFGVFLAYFARTRQQVQGLSTLIILVMSAIGGSMIPVIFMPEIMQKIAVLSVNYWSIQSFYDLFWRNIPITEWNYISRVLILLLIGIVLNVLAIVMFKRNVLKTA